MKDKKHLLTSEKDDEMFNELEKIVNSYYNKWFNEVKYDDFLYLLILRYCNYCNSKEKICDIIISMEEYLDRHYSDDSNRRDYFNESIIIEKCKEENNNKFLETGKQIRTRAKEIVLEFMLLTPQCDTSSFGMEQAEIFNQCGFGWGHQENATMSNQQYWIVALLKQLEEEGRVKQDEYTLLWKVLDKSKTISFEKKDLLGRVEELKKDTLELITNYMTECRNDKKNMKGFQQAYLFRQCGFDFGNYEKAESTRQQFWVIGALRYLERKKMCYRGKDKRWFLLNR